ncbi:unnamed protein product [Kuraishia capsulata CBS 1993]|uniref:Phosphatidate cytidylyltransferase n=1 Tax=Kuraishia capsulata CBS 1993 TaxID=1382522 RepID=W6MPM1_9ASCO|nr:uncharacterized protein KUCA_T00003064001 [Kuraishia capsulata CBS 1993]CDK27087.1 unnamed protein product [Kuraishia capsulata CBS 1993]
MPPKKAHKKTAPGSTPPSAKKEQNVPTTVVNEKETKKQAFVVRTIWTLLMIFGMFSIIGAGHIWTIALVLVLQTLVFKECITITTETARLQNLPFTKTLNWYFLFTSIYYLDGKSLMSYFTTLFLKTNVPIAIIRSMTAHHKFIAYCLYVLGFVFFVASLKKGYYKFQFAQLCITHMTLLLVVLQSYCIISNIIQGMIWFLLPVGLVITNDIFAYICGITFGRTQLIAISPKKTVEGFVGAWFFTGLMSVGLAYFLSNYSFFICPAEGDLSVSVLSGLTCDPNPVFIEQIFKLPPDLAKLIGRDFVSFKPIYFHAMILATFASLIAPFGGFFASGLKRAFKAKDFGNTIPGHGGITDRMDCQFMMGSFSYLYYETFISTHRLTLGSLLQTVVINLNPDEILMLVQSLHSYLNKIGVIDDKVYKKLEQLLQ